MSIVYCEDWDRERRAPRAELTVEEARGRYDAGALVTELTFDGDDRNSPWRRKVQLHLATDYAYVDHRDDLGRSTLTHSFVREPNSRLFLWKVVVQRFVGDDPDPVARSRYVFFPDGQLRLTESSRDYADQSFRTTLDDVSMLWEPVPEFGDFAGLAQVERGLPGAGARPIMQ